MSKNYLALARVSSREQEREGFSLDVQEDALRRYAQQHDGNIVPDRIDVPAALALQSFVVLLQLKLGLAERAHQQFKQLCADSHNRVSV